MANFVITNQLAVTVNSTAITDDVTAFAIEAVADAQDSSTYGSTWRTQLAGLKSGTVTLSFNQNYAATKASAVVNALLGSYATVVASGTLGGTAVAGTAVCLVSTVNPIGGAVGDLSVQNLTWPTSGSVTGFGL
jgi:hypothetical protein